MNFDVGMIISDDLNSEDGKPALLVSRVNIEQVIIRKHSILLNMNEELLLA